jgi:hypothetical protein
MATASSYLTWLTILDSGLTRRFDLHVLGWRKLDLRTNLILVAY